MMSSFCCVFFLCFHFEVCFFSDMLNLCCSVLCNHHLMCVEFVWYQICIISFWIVDMEALRRFSMLTNKCILLSQVYCSMVHACSFEALFYATSRQRDESAIYLNICHGCPKFHRSSRFGCLVRAMARIFCASSMRTSWKMTNAFKFKQNWCMPPISAAENLLCILSIASIQIWF